MLIREATENDYDAVWDIFKLVIRTGDTYVFDPETKKEDLKKHWFSGSMRTFVLEKEERVLGTYIIKPNQIDLGSHIANASYMVHPEARGQGVGKSMGEHSLMLAKELGFLGIQFNFIVSTNKAAIALWTKLGFRIVGTLPQAFKHSGLGLVDVHIMLREL